MLNKIAGSLKGLMFISFCVRRKRLLAAKWYIGAVRLAMHYALLLKIVAVS